MRRARYVVARTFRENQPDVWGVYDTRDQTAGFNGRLVSEHETHAAARTDARALNADHIARVRTALGVRS